MQEKSYKQLIDFLEPIPFQGGERVYVKGSFAYEFIYHLLIERLTNTQKEAILVDGGNVFDPYSLVGEAKKKNGLEVLDRIKICRGFTAYQYFDIVHKKTEDVFGDKTEFILSLEPSKLLLDQEIKTEEGKRLLKGFLKGFNSYLNERNDLIIIDNTLKYTELLDSFSSQKIVFRERKNRMEVDWNGDFFYLDPSINPYQTTLKRFMKHLEPLKEPISFEEPQKKIKDFI